MSMEVVWDINRGFADWLADREEGLRTAQQHRRTKTNGPAQQAGPNAFKQEVETPEGVKSTLQASGSGVSVNGNGDVTGGTITSYAIIHDANNRIDVSGFAPISAVDFYNNTKESVSTEARYNFLVSLSDGETTGIGSDGSDGFEVGSGDDTVNSGDSDDAVIKFKSGNLIFNGGDGFDSLIFVPEFGADPAPTQNLVVDLGAETGANPFGGTLTLISVENIIGTIGTDTITGNDSANYLDGHRGGDDTISGGIGNDIILVAVGSGGTQQHLNLDGGGDTDKLVYDIAGALTTDNTLDLTTPSNNSGAFQFVTVANFEVYRVGDLTGAPGTRKVDFRGTDNAETVTTGNADDTIDGKGGNDILAGGKGNDTIHGGDGDDTLYTKLPNVTDNAATVDHLFGDAGNDTLHSFRASGTIDGGADTDKAVIDRRGPPTNLTLDISDFAHTSVSQALGDGTSIVNIEQVEIMGGDGDDSFTGGALDDVLQGGFKGDNTLIGNGGSDTLVAELGLNHLDGGAGNDTLQTIVSNIGTPNAADVIDGGADSDLLMLDWSSFTGGITLDITNPAAQQTLADGTTIINIEQLQITPGDGADIVTGGALADTFGFSFIANAGNDVFNGAGGNDIMFGGLGNDTLNGGADSDTLTGGAGKDSQTGGLGIDTFDFNSKTESTKASRDIILDFKRGEDKIDLDSIDAKSKVAGDQDFKWIGKAKFHHKAGELHFVKHGKNVYVEGDIDGNGKADFQIQVNKMKALGAGDFDL